MPLCIHLGIPLSTHTDVAYEQEQIDALAELGVELRCALSTLSCSRGWGPAFGPAGRAAARAELWAVRADGVEDQDEATAAERYAEADCLMMVGHVHIDAELLDKCAIRTTAPIPAER